MRVIGEPSPVLMSTHELLLSYFLPHPAEEEAESRLGGCQAAGHSQPATPGQTKPRRDSGPLFSYSDFHTPKKQRGNKQFSKIHICVRKKALILIK